MAGAFLLPLAPALAAPYDGVWTGTSTPDNPGPVCGTDSHDVIVHIEDSWLSGSSSLAGEIGGIVYGQLDSNGAVIYGEAYDYQDHTLDSTYTGAFSGASADIHWTNAGNNCTGTVTLTKQVSYDTGFNELWYGEA